MAFSKFGNGLRQHCIRCPARRISALHTVRSSVRTSVTLSRSISRIVKVRRHFQVGASA